MAEIPCWEARLNRRTGAVGLAPRPLQHLERRLTRPAPHSLPTKPVAYSKDVISQLQCAFDLLQGTSDGLGQPSVCCVLSVSCISVMGRRPVPFQEGLPCRAHNTIVCGALPLGSLVPGHPPMWRRKRQNHAGILNQACANPPGWAGSSSPWHRYFRNRSTLAMQARFFYFGPNKKSRLF